MALRYQRQTLYSDSSGVKTHRGLDPLTGLPVLIYEFSGKPDPALADLESENIPGVLETFFEAGKGQVIVAYSKGYIPASQPLNMSTFRFVMESARALSDAARAGVIHGDLRPERFLIFGDHVLVEGFGIPWTSTPHPYSPPEGVASYAGDVYAFGKIMQELAPDLPVPIKTLLDRCLVRKPEDRPSAGQLLTALGALQPKPAQQPATPQPTVPPVQPSARATPQPPQTTQAPPQQTPPQQKTLEIDFTVSEPDPPQAPPVKMPPINVPPVNVPNAKTPTLPDMPELDLFPEDDPNVSSPTPNLKQPMSLDNWDDDTDPLLLETDSGRTPTSTASVTSKSSISNSSSKPVLPNKTSGKLPETGPKRPGAKTIDPKQTFIKDLPPGGTYKAGKTTEVSSAPFKETPLAPTFDEVFLKGNKSSKNTLRIVMVISLLLGALILAGLVFFRGGRVNPGPTETNNGAANYVVSVNVTPSGLPPLELVVVSSPEGSKFSPGMVASKIPGPVVLDRLGTWQFQARFQESLSEPVTLQLPEQRSLTVTMPNLLPASEGEEPQEGETVEPTTPDDANP